MFLSHVLLDKHGLVVALAGRCIELINHVPSHCSRQCGQASAFGDFSKKNRRFVSKG